MGKISRFSVGKPYPSTVQGQQDHFGTEKFLTLSKIGVAGHEVGVAGAKVGGAAAPLTE